MNKTGGQLYSSYTSRYKVSESSPVSQKVNMTLELYWLHIACTIVPKTLE